MQLKELMKQKGLTQMDIGRELWPDSEPNTQKINAWKLVNGKTRDTDWIKKLCKLLEVSSLDLLGY